MLSLLTAPAPKQTPASLVFSAIILPHGLIQQTSFFYSSCDKKCICSSLSVFQLQRQPLLLRHFGDTQIAIPNKNKNGEILELERRHIVCIPLADSSANPIPNFIFWSGHLVYFGSNRNMLHAGRNRTRNPIWFSGHSFVCLCDSSAVHSGSVGFSDIENSSQRRLLLCLAPRRLRFVRPWTQASKPALTDYSLTAKRRAEALH